MPGVNDDDRLRVFIGDVQGCATELEDLLTELRYDPRRHALYYCGDLVNRGPRSLDALRLARETAAGAVLGNHDLHLIARAAGGRESKPLDTLDDVLGAEDGAQLVAWLQSRPVIIEWDDLVLVHAGIHPRWTDLKAVNTRVAERLDPHDPFTDPDLRFATTARFCDPEGNQPPWKLVRAAYEAAPEDIATSIIPPFAPWDSYWPGPRTIVFGHWAQRGLVRGEFARGLDTGCVWGGNLTAWIAEEDRVVSVPARATYQAPT
jgi:bis(5'-nucleosyl)-tetraphosphatase (symmetrical)